MSSFSNQNESAGNSNADPHKHRLDYQPVVVDECLEEATRRLIRLAIQEDLSNSLDWTTVCLIDQHQIGACNVVAREEGVACEMALSKWIIDEMDVDLTESCLLEDGASFQSGQTLIELQGNVRDLLTAERTILNLLSRLCGIATLTARYVKAMSSQTTRLYDTRKTTPGWRLLEKYAVLCGGAHNHRTGLHDGFLIKDNHLALAGTAAKPLSVAEATARAIHWRDNSVKSMQAPSIVEVEVDNLEQLQKVLPELPNIVLLDNFSLEQLVEAVALRDQISPSVELEASGNIRIETIRGVAATGVDRISSGALTHQATSLDLGLDWFPNPQ